MWKFDNQLFKEKTVNTNRLQKIVVNDILRTRYGLPKTLDPDLCAAFAELGERSIRNMVCLYRYALIALMRVEDIAGVGKALIGFLRNGGHPMDLLRRRLPKILRHTLALALVSDPSDRMVGRRGKYVAYKLKVTAQGFYPGLELLACCRKGTRAWEAMVAYCRKCAAYMSEEGRRAEALRSLGAVTGFTRDFAPFLARVRSLPQAERFPILLQLRAEGCSVGLAELETAAGAVPVGTVQRYSHYRDLAKLSRGTKRVRLYMESFRSLLESGFAKDDPDMIEEYLQVFAAAGTPFFCKLVNLVIDYSDDKVRALLAAYKISRNFAYLERARKLAAKERPSQALFGWSWIFEESKDRKDLARMKQVGDKLIVHPRKRLPIYEVCSTLCDAYLEADDYGAAKALTDRIRVQGDKDACLYSLVEYLIRYRSSLAVSVSASIQDPNTRAAAAFDIAKKGLGVSYGQVREMVATASKHRRVELYLGLYAARHKGI